MKFLILFLFAALTLNANDLDRLELTLNCRNEFELPRNFRCFSQDNTSDMPELRASASGQFSEKGFFLLLENIPKSPLIIVDLREESHCFVNGHAVCWRTKQNCANRGKSLECIENDETERKNMLLKVPCIVLDEIFIHPDMAFSEKTLVESAGACYLRIPITDHRVPSDEAVDRFVSFFLNLPPDAWVHYHCSAGKGRSSTFMVMHDIMTNGMQLSLKDILLRQSALGGKNFTLPCNTDSWKSPYAQERMLFIHMFYQYYRETNGSISWSDWTKNRI